MTDIILNRAEQQYVQIVEDLNKPREDGITAGLITRLHSGQIEALKPLYNDDINLLLVPSGRKFGKSELAMYVLWKQALMHPGSACYYVAPEGSHGRKLVWDNWRLQRFLGEDSKKYTKKPRNQEMMLPFINGSFIQVIGSENYGAANGLTPHIAVYDEMKLFHPRWHIDFAPNLVAKAAKLVIIGTYPAPGDRNFEQYFEICEYAKIDKRAKIVERTTFDNPINHLPAQKESIQAEIARLRARGEEDVVQREYYSKIVPGGKRAIFPMLDSKRHVKPHHELMTEIAKDKKRLEWAWIADPGNTTAFAMLFAALNRYTGKVYILDEIYEKDQNNTSVGVMVPKGKTKCYDLYKGSSIEDDWLTIADEAAAWFITEAMSRYGIYFSPAEKWKGTKEEGLSLIKDQLLHNIVTISDRCQNLVSEMEQYSKDGNGKIPKRNDHLIDCYRYLNMGLNYDFNTIAEYVRNPEPLEVNRFRHPADDYMKPSCIEDMLDDDSEFDLDYWDDL